MEPHLEPGKCPGQKYFDKKDATQNDEIKKIVTDALGDVPKYMKMAGENRMWLVWLSAGFIVVGGLIIAHLT